MRWWRYSVLARVVAMVILSWTAADVTNASLCALDSGELGAAYAAESSATLHDRTSNETPAQTGHIDDCFCCSHCVEVEVFVPQVVAEPNALREFPRDASAPHGFGFPLYHPPLA